MVPIEGEEYLMEPIGKHHAGDLLSPTVSRTGFDSRNNRIFNISYPFPKLGLIEKKRLQNIWFFGTSMSGEQRLNKHPQTYRIYSVN